MPFTPWQSTKSDGTLPNQESASEFQYRHYLQWDIDSNVFGFGTEVVAGGWTMQLLSPTGIVLFQQQVKIKLRVVKLGFFGLTLYTWYWEDAVIYMGVGDAVQIMVLGELVDGIVIRILDGIVNVKVGNDFYDRPYDNVTLSGRSILTTVVNGTICTPENPSWKYTLGNTPFSEFNTFEIGGGSDYFEGTVPISDIWDSPVYKMQLEPGCKLHVIEDNWGFAVPNKRPEWQFRFRLGGSVKNDVAFQVVTEMVTAVQQGEDVALSIYQAPYNLQVLRQIVLDNASCPSVYCGQDGRIRLGALTQDGYHVFESYDNGRTLLQMTSVSVFPGGVTMPSIISIEGGTLAIGVVGNELQVCRVTEFGPENTVVVTEDAGSKVYSMAIQPDKTITIIDSSGTAVFYSQTNGRTWEAY